MGETWEILELPSIVKGKASVIMRFYKPNTCNMVLKLSRFTLKGHHPSHLLSDKNMAGEYLEILCPEYWSPEGTVPGLVPSCGHPSMT